MSIVLLAVGDRPLLLLHQPLLTFSKALGAITTNPSRVIFMRNDAN